MSRIGLIQDATFNCQIKDYSIFYGTGGNPSLLYRLAVKLNCSIRANITKGQRQSQKPEGQAEANAKGQTRTKKVKTSTANRINNREHTTVCNIVTVLTRGD